MTPRGALEEDPTSPTGYRIDGWPARPDPCGNAPEVLDAEDPWEEALRDSIMLGVTPGP